MEPANNIMLGQLSFDARSGELRGRARTRRLEPKAADVLQILCEHRGTVVSRQHLLDRCWGVGEGSDEALTQAVAQVRRALEQLGEPDLVETLAKRGYRVGNGQTVDSAPAASSAKQLRWLISAILTAAILTIATCSVMPHSARHAVRHALGLGPG